MLRRIPVLALGVAAAAAFTLNGSAAADAASHHASSHRHAQRRSHRGPLASIAPPIPPGGSRWYVAPRAHPASVLEENQLIGTSSWRLSGTSKLGGEATGDVEGYVSDQAPKVGESETVYVNAPDAKFVSLDVYRIGWYDGTGGRLVLATGLLPAVAQQPCAHDTVSGITECNWQPTFSFQIPTYLTSGVYSVKITTDTGEEADSMFVLRPASPPRIFVQIPVATYQAYNFWGGDSLYPDGLEISGLSGSTQGYEVSYDRPYESDEAPESDTGAGEFFDRDIALVRFLERYGYPVGYTTDFSISEEPDQLRGASVVIDSGHSEYWSTSQFEAFMEARERGTSLLFLSSDTAAWRVRYGPAGSNSSAPGVPYRTMISYKQNEAHDPNKTEPTGYFPFSGAPLTGSAYDGCITPRTKPTGPPIYRYYDWRPDRSLTPRWLFQDTGLTARSTVPGIAGYELDERDSFSPPNVTTVGESVGVSCRHIAHVGSTGETTLFTAPSGSLVFAAGMLGWLYGLNPVPGATADVPSRPSKAIVQMTRNVLARALSVSSPVALSRRRRLLARRG